MTKDGIEYNLNITPYVFKHYYYDLEITYKFSSQLYLDKFLEFICNDESESVRVNCIKADLRLLKDIKAYSKIEKRGFHIVKNDEVIFNNLNDITVIPRFDII